MLAEFSQAMDANLTKEQCYKLYETNGSCNGTGLDKKRKSFAIEHAHIPLEERMELFANTFGRWTAI